MTPKRDLWSDIEAQIDADGAAVESPRKGFTPHWYQMAAAVLLVIASSVTTYILVRGSGGEQQPVIVESQPLRPEIVAMPASFAGQRLGEDYAKARASLDAAFEQRLALLPPVAREKVERNLTDIRVAAREIADTLAQHPSDPLLQELLLSTYQSELRLLADVTQMAPATATRVNL